MDGLQYPGTFEAPPAHAFHDDGAPAARSPTERLLGFIGADRFPCVGAKAALARGHVDTIELGRLGSTGGDARLLDAIADFARALDGIDDDVPDVYTLVALFDGPRDLDEPRFEALLWNQLQRLHELDLQRGARWAPDVSHDPADPRFSMSLAGHPFFVIGLHPGASRQARRFARPALVFNSHRQFERLRRSGRFERIRRATRRRDAALQGSINPNLADYGAASEARQYSGRRTGPGWSCPFHYRGNA